MMIDPNGEKTKYADPVQDGDYAVHGGMDAIGARNLGELTRNGSFNINPLFGMNVNNTLMAAGGGGNAIAAMGKGIIKLWNKLGRLFDRADYDGQDQAKGIDYHYNGVKLSKGGRNGLSHNRIVRIDKKGRMVQGDDATLDIGNARLQLTTKEDGQIVGFKNNPEMARGVFIFVSKSSNEWSYVEYKLKSGAVHSRIATSYLHNQEKHNASIANFYELDKFPSELVYWLSIHTHPYHLEAQPSDDDWGAWNEHLNQYKDAKNDVMRPGDSYKFYQFINQHAK